MHIFVYIKIYIHVHRIREHPHFFFWLICINVNAQRGKFTSTVMPNKPVGFAGTQGGGGRGKRERLWYNSICPPPKKKKQETTSLYTRRNFSRLDNASRHYKNQHKHTNIFMCAHAQRCSHNYIKVSSFSFLLRFSSSSNLLNTAHFRTSHTCIHILSFHYC